MERTATVQIAVCGNGPANGYHLYRVAGGDLELLAAVATTADLMPALLDLARRYPDHCGHLSSDARAQMAAG